MSAPVKFDETKRGLWDRLFEPPAIGKMAPLTKIIVYSLLGFWTLFVLFPIYWVVITSFKLPQHVNQGPVYLPFIDFSPSLHAWKTLFRNRRRRHAALLHQFAGDWQSALRFSA